LKPGVLSLYIFRRVLARTANLVACLAAVLLTVQILNNVSFLITARNGAAATFYFTLLMLPTVVGSILPFAVLIAIYRTFESMKEESELIGIAATGRSRSQCVWPAIMAAGLLSTLCLSLSVFVEPQTNKMATELITEIRSDIFRQAAYAGGFKKIADNVLVRVGHIFPDDTLGDILIIDTRMANAQTIYMAKQGRLSDVTADNLIVLSEGEMLIKNRADELGSRIQFASYGLSLADANPKDEGNIRKPKAKSTAELLAGCETCSAGDQRLIAMELTARLSDWLYVLSFAAMTSWFGSLLRTNRDPVRWGAIGPIAVGLVIRGLGFVAVNGAGISAVAATLSFLIPVSTFILFGALTVYDRAFPDREATFRRLTGEVRMHFSVVYSSIQRGRSQVEGRS
jgi:lipopolysaccharide export system permease protein